MDFTVKARRVKSELNTDKQFYWFYVTIYLERTGNSRLNFNDIVLVEYHLIDKTITDGDIRVTKSDNGFGYNVWLYGFIKASAEIFTKTGERIYVPPTPLSWTFSESEVALNGKRELSW